MGQTHMDMGNSPVTWGEVEDLLGSDRETRQSIVRRLLAVAARNVETGPGIVAEEIRPARGQYDAAIRQALVGTKTVQSRLERERHDAARLWHTLEGHPPARQRVMVRNDRRFQTWGLFDCLQKRAWQLLEEEPEAALEAAELSWVVAQTLDHVAYGDEPVHDFQGSALVVLSNARRVAGDLEGAKAALDQAQTLLPLGTGDLLDRAELETVRADLLKALGETEAAEAARHRAGRLQKRVGGLRDRTAEEAPHEPLHHRLHAAIPGFRPRRR